MNDQEVVKLSGTQQQLVDKIQEGPKVEELRYQTGSEDMHYGRRAHTKQICAQMTDFARDHKSRQDDTLRRNAALRDQIQ